MHSRQGEFWRQTCEEVMQFAQLIPPRSSGTGPGHNVAEFVGDGKLYYTGGLYKGRRAVECMVLFRFPTLRFRTP